MDRKAFERLVDERIELTQRISLLENKLKESDILSQMLYDEYICLNFQLHTMRQYANILIERIDRNA